MFCSRAALPDLVPDKSRYSMHILRAAEVFGSWVNWLWVLELYQKVCLADFHFVIHMLRQVVPLS